jgi:hypothetical protein
MKNENFAERLFCDLRNAEIKIEKPFYSEGGGRIGDVGNGVNGARQFNILGIRDKYSFSEGLTCDLEPKLTFTEAYQILLNKIVEMNKVKFYSLATPQKGPESAKLEEFEKVVTRYIKDYLHMSDDVIERWDILIQQL